MLFVQAQKTIRDAIAAHPTFAPNAASTVFEDVGTSRTAMEAALDVTSDPTRPGYAIGVWPPARLNADSEVAGATGGDALFVVRFDVNPIMLGRLPGLVPPVDPAAWLNQRLVDLIAAVLAIQPDLSGVRFALAADAFELMDFDEGLIRYHVRFARFVVIDASGIDPYQPADGLNPPKTLRMTDSVTGQTVLLTIQDGQIQIA